MTAICSGGTSSARPGFGASVALTVPAIAGLLNNIPTPWAVGFAAYLGLIAYDLNTFCTVDPPAVPTITAADALALLTFLDPIGHAQAVAKFEQLVGAYAWYQLCQCDSVATPAPPTPPGAPVGLPNIDPPALGPPRPPADPCQTFVQGAWFNVDPGLTQHTGVQSFLGLGVTSVEFTLQTQLVTPPGPSCEWQIVWMHQNADNTLTTVRTDTIFPGVTETIVRLIVPPDGATAQQTLITAYSGTGRVQENITIRYFCGGNVPGGPPTPCPADPMLAGMLAQILELVTLIQRQAVPFAYISGASHTGLTGNGQLAVQGLIGAKVTITANAPGTIGVQAGDPEYLWDAGWINWGSADGFSPRQVLSATTTLSLPPNAGAYTLLGYSLAPGVVVTIQELAREP